MYDPSKALDWDDDETPDDGDWLHTADPAELPDACSLDDPDCEVCQ